jgi:hypothetical protein
MSEYYDARVAASQSKKPPGAMLRYDGRLYPPQLALTLYRLGLAIMVACQGPNSLS